MKTELQATPKDKIYLPEKMGAILFYGPQDLRYEQVNIPEIQDSEILLKIKAAIVGGSSYKTYLQGHPVLVNKDLPSPFGHQFAGKVVRVGKKITKFKVGDRVVAINSSPCFKCKDCNKQNFHLCENISFLNGAFAEYLKIPANITKHNAYIIPPHISFEVAAELESLAVVLHGLEKSEVTKESTVCVIGTGNIGLFFTLLAKEKGARVIAVGRNENKLKLAKEMGADQVLDIKDSRLQDYNPDIVIDAVGKPEIWELAVKLVSKGGVVNFFGGCKEGSKFELDTYKVHYKQLKLIGVFHHTPLYVKKAFELLCSSDNLQEKIKNHIISTRIPLAEIKKAFKLHKEGRVVQTVIVN